MSDYNVQANFTVGGVLWNVNGNTYADVKQKQEQIVKDAPAFYENLILVEQAARATAAFNKTTDIPAATAAPEVPSNKSEPPPWDGDVQKCACGIPMNDVRGQVYKSGAKAGQPYPADFYAGKDCKNKCKPVKL